MANELSHVFESAYDNILVNEWIRTRCGVSFDPIKTLNIGESFDNDEIQDPRLTLDWFKGHNNLRKIDPWELTKHSKTILSLYPGAVIGSECFPEFDETGARIAYDSMSANKIRNRVMQFRAEQALGLTLPPKIARAWFIASKTWEVTNGGLAQDCLRIDLPLPEDPRIAWVRDGGAGTPEDFLDKVERHLAERAKVIPKGTNTGEDERAHRLYFALYGARKYGYEKINFCARSIGKWGSKKLSCDRPAGKGTGHEGVGRCEWHGGNTIEGRAEGGWLMAHAFGRELDISPMEALLKAVRIAAGKSAYCEYMLASATSDLELEGRVTRGEGPGALLMHPDTGEPLGVGEFRDLTFWVNKSELWHDRLAKTSKLAIDAGVAAWQIERIQTSAAEIVRVLNAIIEGVSGQITDDLVMKMRHLAREELLMMDKEKQQVSISSNPDAPVVDSTYSP